MLYPFLTEGGCASHRFMCLGARNIRSVEKDGKLGMQADVTILPFNKDGSRSARPRTMQAEVLLNHMDYYDVTVSYPKDGTTVIHSQTQDVDCTQIAGHMLALDYDGDEALNPRYIC